MKAEILRVLQVEQGTEPWFGLGWPILGKKDCFPVKNSI